MADLQRRRAFIIGAIAVIGQEACGVLAILQYAERLFVLAREEIKLAPETSLMEQVVNKTVVSNLMDLDKGVTLSDLAVDTVTVMPVAVAPSAELLTPARHAVIIGAVQLATSALSLYLVERVGRRVSSS